MSNISEMLFNALVDYRFGYALPITSNPEATGQFFERNLGTELEKLIMSRLSLTEQMFIGQSARARNQGLMAARQGDLIKGIELISKARLPQQSFNPSLECTLFHKSFQEPAEAYIDYCRGDFELAKQRLIDALVSDAILEQEYGYKILFLHRLHLVCNIARNDVKRLNYVEAVELASQILSYLQGSIEVLPFGVSWGFQAVADLPQGIVEVIFSVVINELAFILAQKNRLIASDLFTIVQSYIELDNTSRFESFSQAHQWLIIKQSLLNNDVAEFLEKASEFMFQGRRDNPILWYATAIDLYNLCEELDIAEAELVREVIATDAPNWEFLPTKFLGLVTGSPEKVAA